MAEDYQHFNLKTMSGVFPGTRTLIFQRLRLSLATGGLTAPRWARLQWYTSPAACVLSIPAELVIAPAPDDGADSTEGGWQLHFAEPLAGDFRRTLRDTLRSHNLRLRACGSCAHWRQQSASNEDGVPLGRCSWRGPDVTQRDIPPALLVQSMLAVDCRHWQDAGFQYDEQEPEQAVLPAPAPMRKRAEQETNERWTWWGRLKRALVGQPDVESNADGARGWEAIVVERSGVGAGTEQCHACNGRIANLGALTVATEQGDKETFSVWRCRLCYTFYLNDWIDRWERLESLETEETYYRLAPAEALAVLAVIDNVVDAEHPARRHERDAQRRWMLTFLAGHLPLSHQVRQGR